MRVLLNFVPLKLGGGVQVGLDFLEQVRIHGRNHEWFLVATEGTPFATVKPSENLKIVKILQRSLFARARFEYLEVRKLAKEVGADVIYTQFGPHWPSLRIPQVVGCAYSNLFYPEVDFWARLPFFKRAVKRIIDRYRMHRVKQADVVVLETPELGRRARRHLGASYDIRVVLPAPSAMVQRNRKGVASKRGFIGEDRRFKILMLSGYHPNKNIELLPRIAECFLKAGEESEVLFVLTLPARLGGAKDVMSDVIRRGVSDMFVNVGPVAPQDCESLYKECNAVILPSRLESFSNNIVEAWYLCRPLLISDLDWARDICGEGASYFHFDDASDAYLKLKQLISDDDYRSDLIRRGTRRLRQYPTSEERFRQYVNILEEKASGDCGSKN